MKKLPILLVLCLTSCASIDTRVSEQQKLMLSQQTSKDPIDAIKLYQEYDIQKSCGTEYENAKEYSLVGLLTSLLVGSVAIPISLMRTDYSEPPINTGTAIGVTAGSSVIGAIIGGFFANREFNKCAKDIALADQNIKFVCMYDDFVELEQTNGLTYNSDECVVYRRTAPESSVKYFDYKRFLPESSPIKTDAQWLKLVDFYNDKNKCVKNSQTTTTEVTDCENIVINRINLIAASEQDCALVWEQEYKNKLTEANDFYKWEINHDPYERRKNLEFAASFEYSYDSYILSQMAKKMYDPVLTPSEARADIAEMMKEFGQEHLCSTKNWRKDMNKLGFKI